MRQRICLVPKLSGVGGMVSFQARLARGLTQRGIEVVFDLKDTPYHAVLVVGGTRRIIDLVKAHRKGIPVIQRLDGMNWLHKAPGTRKIGLRHWLRAEAGNWLLQCIRSRLAIGIVYQSHFSQSWWERVYGTVSAQSKIIYNAVDLSIFSPDVNQDRSTQSIRLLLVEGSLLGGYEFGLENAIRLAECLHTKHQYPIELVVVGRVDSTLQVHWNDCSGVPIQWTGVIPQIKIPEIDRSAHLLFSADLNAACPNSVIEALACGLPVVAFDTGSLMELVGAEGGMIVPYGGNPWKLDQPDIPSLAKAAAHVLTQQEQFRQAARQRAEAMFNVEKMVDAYLEVLTEGIAL